MPTNDPTQDAYNPPGNLSQDFEENSFGELNTEELFWQTNQPGTNIPWRKINENQGLNIKAQTVHNFKQNTKVWQKI
tara:strand:+ start:147 stop:377 length:231 start_codon:yes stop_codon:yes gene_type:complete